MKRLNALTFKQLRAADAVARTGSIAGAAAEIGLTAPAVHSQLRTLEDLFGCKILDRRRSESFRPTAEGEALLAAWRSIRIELENAVRRIDALQAGLAGTVILGVVSTAKYFAPGVVARLHATYPDIDIVLRVGNRDAIVSALKDNAIDLAIMGRPPRDPVVEAHGIGDHPHVLIAPPDHPLLSQADPARVLDETIIVREQGSGTRILATRFLDQLGSGRPYRRIEMDSNETIKQAVIAGLGIAVISAHTCADELATGRLATVPLAGLPIIRQWFLIRRQDRAVTGAMASVEDFIAENGRALLPKLPDSPN